MDVYAIVGYPRSGYEIRTATNVGPPRAVHCCLPVFSILGISIFKVIQIDTEAILNSRTLSKLLVPALDNKYKRHSEFVLGIPKPSQVVCWETERQTAGSRFGDLAWCFQRTGLLHWLNCLSWVGWEQIQK